jgi:predicted metal-dependent hydrolase
LLALAAGVMHTSVEGQPGSGAEPRSVDQWSFLMDGSLGAGLRLYRRYYLTMAAHVQMAEPYVAIHFVDAVVATSGRPNLLLTLTVGAWL